MGTQGRMKKVMILIFVFCGLLLCIKYIPPNTREVVKEDAVQEMIPFKMIALEVGKADALLLLTEKGTVVIDTGEEEDGRAIVDYLIKEERTVVDYLVITHFDKDHVGGADTLLKELEVKQIYQTNTKKKSTDYEEYIEETKAGEEKVRIVDEITEFSLDGVNYKIFPPADQYDKKKSNNSSLIVSASYGDNNFLFMGDAMGERVDEYLEYEKKVYDVVKIPYHGRYLENIEEFLMVTKPKYAIVTSSEEDLEDARTIQALKQQKAEILLTREGSRIIGSDGKEVYLVN